MASQETGKQRAVRIPLDYFKRTDALERWKLWLSGLAALLAAGWLGAYAVRSDSGRGDVSRGPVASVHAAWENNCNACHVAFNPIGKRPWLGQLSRFVGDSHQSDQRCESCHQGPVHHGIQTPELSCASCHRDHRGRDASLVRSPDGDCTQCHSSLADHMTKAGSFDSPFGNVTRFDRDHPKEFRSAKSDPGKLRFNHQVHLTPGQVYQADGKGQWKLGDIPPELRERYRRDQPADQRADKDAVVLKCSSCHQLDSDDFGVKHAEGAPAAILPPRSAGAYMLPITYENQCRACHPLTFDDNLKDANLKNVAVPHRLQPDQVRDFLLGAYANREVAARPPGLLPDRTPIPFKDRLADDDAIRKAVKDKVANAEQFLYRDQVERAEKSVFAFRTNCGLCHQYEQAKGAPTPIKIVAPDIPQVWFKHASFNHAAHRGVRCEDCHAQALTSKTSQDVLLPGIDNCLTCHAPPGHSEKGPTGGIRFDCVECHRYHNGAATKTGVAGIGSATRGAKDQRSLQEFLAAPSNP